MTRSALAQEVPCSNPRVEKTVFVKMADMSLRPGCGERGPGNRAAQTEGPGDPVMISGHINHQNGVRMSGVILSLRDSDAQTLRTVVSDEQGNYLFDNIPWGHGVELSPSLQGYEFYPPAVIWSGIVEDEVWNFIAVGPPPPTPPPPANQPTLAWSTYFDNTRQLGDYNGLIGRDAAGNIYTGGTSYMINDTSGDTDIVIYKTDVNGNRVWWRSYNGPGNYKEGLRDMAVDAAGNVYLTGFTYSLPEGPSQLRSYNYLTLKYNSAGELLWTRSYGPNAGYDDFPRSLEIDPAGNAYVAGYSWGIGTYANFATVKYDASGNEIWARRFAGGNGEILNDVEVDAGGSVYITGYSNSSSAGGSEDIVTIKYNVAGDQQWLNRYNSAASDSDEGYQLEIDATGNVLVLGETYDFDTSTPLIHKISGASGATIWTRPVTGIDPNRGVYASTIDLDSQGEIVIAGMLYDSSYDVDSFVAKISPEAVTAWVRTYDGPGDGDYDGDPKLVLDGNDNMIAAITSEGFANADIQVIKWGSDGTEDWRYRFGNPYFGDDSILGWDSESAQRTLLVDTQGNVYIAGSSHVPGQSTDLVTFKLEPVAQTRAVPFDFDGDRKADISIFRPSTGTWWILNSLSGTSTATAWGATGDTIVPADYDGDGRHDLAVYRDGSWWVKKSSTGGHLVSQFGKRNDVPVPSDFDNDGRADLSVFRNGFWHLLNSSNNAYTVTRFGLDDDVAIPSDFDSNRRSDIAVYRNGTWYVQYQAGLPMVSMDFGNNTDIVVPADYDGDKRTDFAVFRQGIWWVWQSASYSLRTFQWGMGGDIPVPADYDGDKRADFAVFRSGIWYIARSSDGNYSITQFGLSTDIPLASAYGR